MVEIILRENEDNKDLDRVLREFERKLVRSGHMKDIRRKRFYEKPSVAKKRKAKESLQRTARARRRARQLDWP